MLIKGYFYLKQFSNIKSVSDKHIVGIAKKLFIEVDTGNSIQAVECKINIGLSKYRISNYENKTQ